MYARMYPINLLSFTFNVIMSWHARTMMMLNIIRFTSFLMKIRLKINKNFHSGTCDPQKEVPISLSFPTYLSLHYQQPKLIEQANSEIKLSPGLLFPLL